MKNTELHLKPIVNILEKEKVFLAAVPTPKIFSTDYYALLVSLFYIQIIIYLTTYMYIRCQSPKYENGF